MLVPTVHTPTATNDDHRELAAALKLLAGFECHRDAQQAHTMLVRLTESDRGDVAEDARTVLREGMRKDWFEDRKPFYQDLVALASRTGGGLKSGVQRQLLVGVLAGLLALAFGGFYFFRQLGADIEIPWTLVVLVLLLVIAVFGLILKK